MKKKYCLISLLILPLISACKTEQKLARFYISNLNNEIVELGINELSAKIDTQHDTFLLATHKGDSCTCWTGFEYVMSQYNEKRNKDGKNYLPFYAFDTELMTDNVPENFKIDKVLSGYVEFYIFSEGEIIQKYSKSAAKDLDFFENVDKFTKLLDENIEDKTINNYAYVSYEHVRDYLIKEDNREFALLTVRSGCGDCNYCMPNVVTPFILERGLQVPVYVCDIEKFRGTDDYDTVKANLKLTLESNPLGFDKGVVPTYQYWKNGELLDAGVYANDSFEFNASSNKVEVNKTYFDGTRNLKYTNVNLKTQMGSKQSLNVKEYNGKYFMETKEAAVFHDPLIKSFLTYYCMNK